MFELKLQNGEEVMLYPVLQGSNSFVLLDEKNEERLAGEITDNYVTIKDWKEFDPNNSEDLLEQLYFDLISKKQSGTEENENQLVNEDNPFNPEQIKVNSNWGVTILNTIPQKEVPGQ